MYLSLLKKYKWGREPVFNFLTLNFLRGLKLFFK